MRDTEAGIWAERRKGEEQLLTKLLGAPPRYQLVIDGIQYVIPDGTDPYWEHFSDSIGWRVLPAEEHPAWSWPTPRPNGPERDSEPGWVIPVRTTWPRPENVAAPYRPLVHWTTLGDLRLALRTAKTAPYALRSPRSTVDLRVLHEDLTAATRHVNELETLLPELVAGLDAVQGIGPLTDLREASMHLLDAVDGYVAAVDGVAAWFNSGFASANETFLKSLVTGAQVPLYTLATGDVASTRLFVHAADHIVRTPVGFLVSGPKTDPDVDSVRIPMLGGLGKLNAEVLAMVEALEPEHRFVHDLLESKIAAKRAKGYWRAAMTAYRNSIPDTLAPLPVVDGNEVHPARVVHPVHVPKTPQPGPTRR